MIKEFILALKYIAFSKTIIAYIIIDSNDY